MDNKVIPQTTIEIQGLIYTIRNIQVMLDTELALVYGVETKYLNRAVKRNQERFPASFMFQLTNEEYESSRFQNGTLNETSIKRGQNIKYLPYAFTEQGVAMLSAVLRSETAIKVSIQIIDAFVEMRKTINQHSGLLQRMDRFEIKQADNDQKFEQIFKALELETNTQKQGVFFDGQTFDAYTFTADLIRTAKKSIQLIDNYIDDSVLLLLSKRTKNVKATIYTKAISSTLKLDLKKHNTQYEPIEIKTFDKAHDRFLIIDETKVYHIGASLKDLGKKWFAFSLLDIETVSILDKLKGI